MKLIKNILFPLVVGLLLTAVTTSCDDPDANVADTLDGIWQGTIVGGYYNDRYGLGGQWSTEIQFITDGWSSGYGTEVDYSYYDGRAYRSDFDWEVNNGFIYLYYYDGYTAVIADYRLYGIGNQRRFSGTFQDYYSGLPMANFDLVKVATWGAPYYRSTPTDSITNAE